MTLIRTACKTSHIKSLGTIAIAFLISTGAFLGSLQAHNLVVSGSLSPVGGSTITESEMTLSGTFSNSGCGLGATITVDVDSGTVSPVTSSCNNGTWTWSATWSGYGSGLQGVTVDFLSCCHGGPNQFSHTGSIHAVYLVELESCDAPAAPAIANQYLRSLGYTNRNEINTIISEVAHEMNAGGFGDNPCAPGYADAVRDFVDGLLN